MHCRRFLEGPPVRPAGLRSRFRTTATGKLMSADVLERFLAFMIRVATQSSEKKMLMNLFLLALQGNHANVAVNAVLIVLAPSSRELQWQLEL